jgi:hypothetical protein
VRVVLHVCHVFSVGSVPRLLLSYRIQSDYFFLSVRGDDIFIAFEENALQSGTHDEYILGSGLK